MRIAAVLLALFLATGCTGSVVLHSRSDPPPPQPVPVPSPLCCDVTPRQAAEIAVAEAQVRDCDRLRVEDVKRDGKRYRVELRGACGCREARIRVKVDRRTGAISSYKAKLGDDDCRGS